MDDERFESEALAAARRWVGRRVPYEDQRDIYHEGIAWYLADPTPGRLDYQITSLISGMIAGCKLYYGDQRWPGGRRSILKARHGGMPERATEERDLVEAIEWVQKFLAGVPRRARLALETWMVDGDLDALAEAEGVARQTILADIRKYAPYAGRVTPYERPRGKGCHPLRGPRGHKRGAEGAYVGEAVGQ